MAQRIQAAYDDEVTDRVIGAALNGPGSSSDESPGMGPQWSATTSTQNKSTTTRSLPTSTAIYEL